MKKGIKNLMVATMVGVASMGLMTGCEKESEESKPYIQVSGLDTSYLQDGELNLEGAKILYYSNKNDTTADEITLTESMIANFSTEETGEKKMKVIWNGFELEIDYTVFSLAQFVEAYNTAYNNFLESDNIHADILAGPYQNLVQKINVEVSDNKFYACCKQENSGVLTQTYQDWVEKSDDWYLYSDENQEFSKSNATMIKNDNVNTFAFEYILMLEDEELTLEKVQSFEDVNYEIENSQVVLSFKVNGTEYESDLIIKYKLYIQDGKFIKLETISKDGVEHPEMSCVMTISYNAEDVKMVALPDDADTWGDGSEE